MAEKLFHKNPKNKQPPFPLINNLYHIYCNRFDKIDELYEKNCQSNFFCEKNSNLDIKFSDRFAENIENFFTSVVENELFNVNIYHLSSSHVPMENSSVEIYSIIGLFHFKNEIFQRFSHTLVISKKKIIFEKMIFLDEIVKQSMGKNRRLYGSMKIMRTEDELREIFLPVGKIFDVKIKENYFYVDFQNNESIEKILEKREFYGKKYEIFFSLQQNLK